MKIDYTKMELGSSPGHGILLMKCPACGKPCEHRKSRFEHRYVHELEIVRRFGRNEQDVIQECTRPMERQPQQEKPR